MIASAPQKSNGPDRAHDRGRYPHETTNAPLFVAPPHAHSKSHVVSPTRTRPDADHETAQ